MWTTLDSLHSIRLAAKFLEGRDPADPRCQQIASIVAFARRMVSLAPRVQVHTRYHFPSMTAANDDKWRWVELLALECEFRLEFWERRDDLERPPTPERVQSFTDISLPKWQMWAGHNCESWLCRTETWRWLPPLDPPGAASNDQ